MDILRTPAELFLRYRPEIHLELSALLEEMGMIDAARARYTYILTGLCPNLLPAYLLAIEFERRQQPSNQDEIHRLFQEAINHSEKDEEKAIVTLHWARYSLQVHGDTSV